MTDKTKRGPIAVVIEGGIVQAICTDDEQLQGVDVLVIDYDTEGADESELTDVPQRAVGVAVGSAKAVVRGDMIGAASGIDLATVWVESNRKATPSC